MTETALRSSVSREVAASLLSQRDSVAGALYRVVPSCAVLKISEESFRLFSQQRQCIDLLLNTPSPCSCHIAVQSATLPNTTAPAFAETEPRHATSCALGDGYERRHKAGCMALHSLLRSLPNSCTTPQYNVPQQGATPDFDVMNFPNQGDLAFVEYSVVDPLQRAYLQASSQTAGHAASCRDKLKANKYRAEAQRTNHLIFTASQETTGRISKG